jgi:dUTP pyrophosphatase
MSMNQVIPFGFIPDIPVEIQLDEGVKLPEYKHDGDSGFDLAANEDLNIPAKGVALVSTGIKMGIPKGYEIQVRSRSGLAAKNGVFVLNSPGTVDASYTGEVKVILANFGHNSVHVQKGVRIAQAVLCPVERAEFKVVEKLSDKTTRGEGGFGSTGV